MDLAHPTVIGTVGWSRIIRHIFCSVGGSYSMRYFNRNEVFYEVKH